MEYMKEYQILLDKIEEIKNQGIPVKIEKPKTNRITKKNYVLPFEKWFYVEFTVETEKESLFVLDEKAKLWKQGIYFDSGGWASSLDWQIDWSFEIV